MQSGGIVGLRFRAETDDEDKADEEARHIRGRWNIDLDSFAFYSCGLASYNRGLASYSPTLALGCCDLAFRTCRFSLYIGRPALIFKRSPTRR